MWSLEREWIKAGHSPSEFWQASLRQCLQVLRAAKDNDRSKWEHTLTITAKIHNVNARKKSDMIDPAKMIEKMFGKQQQTKAKTKENLIDKFRMLALQTGGQDFRKSKPS